MSRKLKRLVPSPVRNRMREFSWPQGAMRWLPGTSRTFGPPRRWVTIREYFSAHAGDLSEVLPEQRLHRPHAEFVGAAPPRFLEGFRDSVPPACVFTLRDARILGPEGWIVAPGDFFLTDAGFEANDSRKKIGEFHILRTRRGFAPPQRHLPGRCLSLASDYAVGGFGHFIHDSLARLLLIERRGLKLSEFDWVYLPRLETPNTRELVSKLGIAPTRLLNYEAGVDLCCDELTATSFPGSPGNIAPVYANFLHDRFASAPSGRGRRIYLSRHGHRRNFSNRGEVEGVLRRSGFEEVRSHDDAGTLQKCAEADSIFCAEGANFFNAAFCRTGTCALLVFPDRLPHGLPYALTLAEALRFRTMVMTGKTVGGPEVDGGSADFSLDPAELELALRRMLPDP
jgi:hypothetical protein